MKLNLGILLIICCLLFPRTGNCLETEVNLYILKIKLSGMGQDISNRFDRDFKQLLVKKLEPFDECLRLMGDEGEMTTIEKFFKGDDLEFNQKYGIERTEVIPIRATALIIAKFEYAGDGYYGEITIYDREKELLISTSHDKALPKNITKEQRKEFIQTLIDQAFSDYKIIKLIAGVLNINKTDVKCDIEPEPEAIFRYETVVKKQQTSEIKFIDQSKNAITLQWRIKRNRIFSTEQNILGNQDNLDIIFSRGGKYKVSLIATGLNGQQNIKTQKIKVKSRNPRQGQFWLAGMGGVALAYSGITKLQSNKFYKEHKNGANANRDIDYEKANSLHHISVASLYAGTTVIASSLIWYLLDTDKSLFKNDEKIKTYPTFGIRSNGRMEFGLRSRF